MKTLSSLLTMLCAASSLFAQSQQIPLPGYGSTYSAGGTRGFYFQTPVPITIVGLRVPDETANGIQNVEVTNLGAAPPAFPATASGGQVFYAANVPSNHIIPCRIDFAAGDWVGVLGACGTTTMYNSYGAGNFASSIAGQPVTLSRFITQTNLNTAGGQPYSSAGTASIARVEVYYTSPNVPGVMSMPAFGSTFSSVSLTRGFYFQTPVPIIIRGLRVPDESRDGTQVVEVGRSATPPPAFPSTQINQQVFYSAGQPSYEIIPCYIPFQSGDWITVLGACGSTTLRNSYATPPGAFISDIGGNPVTIARCGTQNNINNTGGNNPVWSEVGGAIGRVEVYFELATGTASATSYGSGCNNYSRSFHELFTPAATHDLNGLAMTLVPSGGRYNAQASGNYIIPSGAATPLALGDDTDVALPLPATFNFPGGSTNSLRVCSNGFVSAGSGNGTAFTPSVTSWYASTAARWGNWHDFNPTATGSSPVVAEMVGTRMVVSWHDVYDYSYNTPNRFQMQFDLSNGRVTYAWQAVSGLGNAHIVGYAAAGGSYDQGSTDISATLPGGFSTDPIDAAPLTLAASARPVIGTTISLDTSNIDGSSIIGANLLGFVPVTIPLGGQGAPGCAQYLQPLATRLFFIGGPTASSNFQVPNDPFLLGLFVSSQSATLTPTANPLGALFSNAIDMVLNLN